jgi:acetyltransferase-like isoleucine patch superfamily enzyme
MSSRPIDDHIEDLLGTFTALVADDRLAQHADQFWNQADRLVSEISAGTQVPVPRDPFKGRVAQAAEDPELYYTMFWRMFDRTPAAMVQALAIPLRRILAKRVFRHCGDGVILHHNVLFSKGSNISLGDHSLVNRYVMLDDRAALDIGAFVMVAAGVTIETHTHPFDDFSLPIAYGGRDGRPVAVGDNTVLGYNVVVMAGVHIGYRCIVGANSVVTADVPDYQVVGGVPARLIKEVVPPESGPVWLPEQGRPTDV